MAELQGALQGRERAVCVRVFGALELTNKWGQAGESRSHASLSWLLLKYLLVNSGREVDEDELFGSLWPAKDNVGTGSAARVRLRRLREALAPLHLDGRNGLVQFSRGRYFLNPDYELWRDDDLFTRLTERIHATPIEDGEGYALCREALELFRGDFLEYTALASWLTQYRDYYHRAFVDLANSTLRRIRATGDEGMLPLLCSRTLAIAPGEAELHRAIIAYMMDHRREVELLRHISQLSRIGGTGVQWLNNEAL
ncbi:MAG: bacterial transcriptional activator domain-containing protein [Candidatus Heteroscillospira sp.]